jgi:hypothetical protein
MGKNTKSPKAKAKIAAHQSSKGRGGAKKSGSVRRREAEIEARADAIEAERQVAADAKRLEQRQRRQQQQLLQGASAHHAAVHEELERELQAALREAEEEEGREEQDDNSSGDDLVPASVSRVGTGGFPLAADLLAQQQVNTSQSSSTARR